ncbi:MAG: hypothetical protein LQ344_004619 [Seirophora lacunosa]|nr:MAG: hypothetical protein LQ344_004619 [Seirophora lacunosa]
MRYSPIIALALASAVVALPAPQDSTTDLSSSSGTEPAGDTTSGSTGDLSSGGAEVANGTADTFPQLFPTGGESFPAAGTGNSFGPSSTAGSTPTTTNDVIFSPTSESTPAPTGDSTPTTTTGPVSELPSSSGSPDASGLLACGSAFYSPNLYTCYSGFLCPILDGTPTRQCGDACYLESLYSCNAGVLVSLSQAAAAGSEDSASDTTASGPLPEGSGVTELPTTNSSSTATGSTGTGSTVTGSTGSTGTESTENTTTGNTGTDSTNDPSSVLPASLDTPVGQNRSVSTDSSSAGQFSTPFSSGAGTAGDSSSSSTTSTQRRRRAKIF